jgi:hypothetical protein
MSLARVEVDIPDSMAGYLKVRSNKAGVDVPATFGPAVHASRAKDGSSFDAYLKRAEEIYRRRGEIKPRPMLAPGSGIPAEVKRALVRRGMKFIRGPECTVTWGDQRGPNFLHVSLTERTIVLNSRYRKMLLRGAHGGKTDVPLLRTLLYFVFESVLSGDRIGPVERWRLEAIETSMNAALQLEQEWADA